MIQSNTQQQDPRSEAANVVNGVDAAEGDIEAIRSLAAFSPVFNTLKNGVNVDVQVARKLSRQAFASGRWVPSRARRSEPDHHSGFNRGITR
ncbi:MAG: hypothetical protein GWP56_13375 [Gammaproteobacteria bacterium]|jgi:hypothetical protein|nr:hypothetical protein [Gammaproteobacteria bacterium]